MNFTNSVLCIVRKIPKGKVTTYGEIAEALGGKKFSRAVGTALKRNPRLVKIPCHRVVCSDGLIGGYKNGINEKIRLLEKEGIKIKDKKNFLSGNFCAQSALKADSGKKILDFEKVMFKISRIRP